MAKKLFVGNISWNVTADDLKTIFEELGAVEDVYLVPNRERGGHKGFGFVTYTNDDDADEAMKSVEDGGLDGKEVDGREIRISEARPRDDQN